MYSARMLHGAANTQGGTMNRATIAVASTGDRFEVALTNGSDRWIPLGETFATKADAVAWAASAALDFGLGLSS